MDRKDFENLSESELRQLKESLDSNNKKVIFSFQDNGGHNETSWATAILEILGKLI